MDKRCKQSSRGAYHIKGRGIGVANDNVMNHVGHLLLNVEMAALILSGKDLRDPKRKPTLDPMRSSYLFCHRRAPNLIQTHFVKLNVIRPTTIAQL